MSRLAQYLLESFGFGFMFATEVQEVASRAVDDHKEDGVSTSTEDLEYLAGLGSSGVHPQNCAAELRGYMRRTHAPPAIGEFDMPQKRLKRRAGLQEEIPTVHKALYPFEMFNHLWTKFPASLGRRFLGGAEGTPEAAERALRAFWARVPDDDPRKQELAREMVKRDDIPNEDAIWGKAIPITIHGEAITI